VRRTQIELGAIAQATYTWRGPTRHEDKPKGTCGMTTFLIVGGLGLLAIIAIRIGLSLPEYETQRHV